MLPPHSLTMKTAQIRHISRPNQLLNCPAFIAPSVVLKFCDPLVTIVSILQCTPVASLQLTHFTQDMPIQFLYQLNSISKTTLVKYLGWSAYNRTYMNKGFVTLILLCRNYLVVLNYYSSTDTHTKFFSGMDGDDWKVRSC